MHAFVNSRLRKIILCRVWFFHAGLKNSRQPVSCLQSAPLKVKLVLKFPRIKNINLYCLKNNYCTSADFFYLQGTAMTWFFLKNPFLKEFNLAWSRHFWTTKVTSILEFSLKFYISNVLGLFAECGICILQGHMMRYSAIIISPCIKHPGKPHFI